jgi:hypothetical protein
MKGGKHKIPESILKIVKIKILAGLETRSDIEPAGLKTSITNKKALMHVFS